MKPSEIRQAMKLADAFIMATLRRECKDMRDRGDKIQAIKLWREVTGDGLQNSKNAVEAL